MKLHTVHFCGEGGGGTGTVPLKYFQNISYYSGTDINMEFFFSLHLKYLSHIWLEKNNCLTN